MSNQFQLVFTMSLLLVRVRTSLTHCKSLAAPCFCYIHKSTVPNWRPSLSIIITINNNNRISIVPYSRNFRGAGGRSDQCSVKTWLNRKVLRLHLKTVRESLMRTVCGSEFQTVGDEDRKARLEKSVLMNGLSSSGMAAERKVRLQVCSAIRRCR